MFPLNASLYAATEVVLNNSNISHYQIIHIYAYQIIAFIRKLLLDMYEKNKPDLHRGQTDMAKT